MPYLGTESVGFPETATNKKYNHELDVYKTSFTSISYVITKPEKRSPSLFRLTFVGKGVKVVSFSILEAGCSIISQILGVQIRLGATKKDFDSCFSIHQISTKELATINKMVKGEK